MTFEEWRKKITDKSARLINEIRRVHDVKSLMILEKAFDRTASNICEGPITPPDRRSVDWSDDQYRSAVSLVKVLMIDIRDECRNRINQL